MHEGLYPDSRRPSLAISLASGMSVASSSAVPSPHDRQDSYGMPLGSSSLRSSLQPSNYSSTSSNTPYLHKSASGLILHSSASSTAPEIEAPAGSGSPQTFAQMAASNAASNAASTDTSPAQLHQTKQHPFQHLQRAPTMPAMQYHPFARSQLQQLAAGVMGQLPPTLATGQHPSGASTASTFSHPSMPPRYQSASELYLSAARSRASSTSAYAAATAPHNVPGASMASNPYHAMAAASGVILSEYEVRHLSDRSHLES